MSTDVLLSRVMLLVPMILSLTVHEYAHAWSAYKLGDDTAARMGRMTLNPIVHIDLFGTLLLPLLGIPFGWAKPVPVNPARFDRKHTMATGMMITAAAGPIANGVLAVLSTVVYGLLFRYAPEYAYGGPVKALIESMIAINIALLLFNLIPVPPLDGSRIVDGLIPLRLRPGWEQFMRFSPILLLAVFWFGGALIAAPSNWAFHLLNRLLTAIAS